MINKIREQINLRIYKIKPFTLSLLGLLRTLVSVGVVGLLIFYHGFPQDSNTLQYILSTISGAFIFYVVSYMLRLFFDFEPLNFIRSNPLEGVLVGLLILNYVFILFTGHTIAAAFSLSFFGNVNAFVLSLLMQAFLLILVAMELGRVSQRITLLHINPSLLFICSFLLLIFGGTALLMLPEMTIISGPMPFLDALFTSTSATCVTGLIVVDTATYFTLKGQIVILLLIQLGGLNIISFATFFAAFMRKGVGLRQSLLIKDFMSYETLYSTKSLVKRVLLISLFLEGFGALCIFLTWNSNMQFLGIADRVFQSVFHSISAFNNAGFSTYSNNLYSDGLRTNYLAQIIIALLIIAGGLGIPVIHDMFSITKMRERMRFPWKPLLITTRLAVITSIILIVVGMVVFYIFEFVHTPHENHLSMFGKMTTAFFQSVTTRTAGFNSVDMSTLSMPVLLCFIVLMFIGASSGGTGGGIKTTTFSVIVLSGIASIRSKKHVEIFKKTLSSSLVYKAFSIFFFASMYIAVCVFVLSITDPDIPIIDLIFEEVSAFATVGLSTGITDKVSVTGRIVLMLSMLVGRVGILTLALSLSRKSTSNNYKYPDGYVMIG